MRITQHRLTCRRIICVTHHALHVGKEVLDRRRQAGGRGREQIIDIGDLRILGVHRTVIGARATQLRGNELIIFTLHTGHVDTISVVAAAGERAVGLAQQNSLTRIARYRVIADVITGGA